MVTTQAVTASFPRCRTPLGCGTRCPGHRMSSYLSGALIKPNRIVGVLCYSAWGLDADGRVNLLISKEGLGSIFYAD